MKVLKHYYLAASIVLSAVKLCHAEEPEPLLISEPLSSKVKQVMKIKTEAMKLPGMRSEEGILGKQVENLMDQIADLASDEIVKQVEKKQEQDIHAKIILWAKDRKMRLVDYNRFAKYYINRPASRKEAEEYFYRPTLKLEHDPFAHPITPHFSVPRPGTWMPHPVDKEDAIEANRYIMEYCFFMPPTGRSFDYDSSRSFVADTIISTMGHKRSSIVFEKDLEIWFLNWKSNQPPEPSASDINLHRFTNLDGLMAIRLIPIDSSFKHLAMYATDAAINEVIRKDFREYWESASILSEKKNEIVNNYQEWIKLAKLNWLDIHEQHFAKFLLSLPAPKKLVHPEVGEPEKPE